MSARTPWLPSLTLLCVCAGMLGGAAALFVPSRQVVQASEVVDSGPRRIAVRAKVRPASVPQPEASTHDPSGQRYRGGMVISGTTRSGAVLFTFDDGPELKTTPRLLAALEKKGIKAIFFIVGERVAGNSRRAAKRRALVREIAARGHLIGNHTFSHRQLTLLSDAEVREEILRTERVLTRIIGRRPWLFRPPGGARSERIDKIISELGYTSVLWNMDTSDTMVPSADQVVQNWLRVVRTPAARDGGVILLHDLHPASVESFEKIYGHLIAANAQRREQGVVPWTVVSDLDAFYVPRADADASDVAPSLTSF